MEWTIGLLVYFSASFFTFFCPFLGPIFGPFFGIFYRGRQTIKVYQYSGRGWRQIVVTEGEVEDELLVGRDGWEVVEIVNATN